RCDWCMFCDFFQLLARYVRYADPPCEAFVDSAGKRARRRGERHPRVRRMQKQDFDGHTVQRFDARYDIFRDLFRASIRNPRATVATHAALGDDASGGRLAASAPNSRDQPLVVSEIRFTIRIGARGIEKRESTIERRLERRPRHLLVTL